MYASERTTQFLITAPFLMIHPRPTTECSREPSIRHPFDTTEFLTFPVSKYCVGQESFVLV